jgi:Cu/Ag efflux protein CusF
MLRRGTFLGFALPVMLALMPVGCSTQAGKARPSLANPGPFVQILDAHGVIRDLPDSRTVIVEHDEIPGVLPAAATPFHVKYPRDLSGLQIGDEVSFQLTVTRTNSWIGQLRKN